MRIFRLLWDTVCASSTHAISTAYGQGSKTSRNDGAAISLMRTDGMMLARYPHTGEVGSGQAAKLAHQLVFGLNVMALLEGLSLGAAGGAILRSIGTKTRAATKHAITIRKASEKVIVSASR